MGGARVERAFELRDICGHSLSLAAKSCTLRFTQVSGCTVGEPRYYTPSLPVGCVCVCLLSSHLFWTSDLWMHQPGSHRRKVAQDFSSTFLLRCCLNFLLRGGLSRPFPSSTVKSNFVYPRINPSPLVGHFYFIFGEENCILIMLLWVLYTVLPH